MPELPEVETVCRNLGQIFGEKSRIQKWKFNRSDLRFEIPKKSLNSLKNQKILRVSRRAKYILIEIENENVIISHLGMTGSWQVEAADRIKSKHDHIKLYLNDGRTIVYNDPRRFGFIEVVAKEHLKQRFSDLGLEPFSKQELLIGLQTRLKALQAPIKIALMDQKRIVGVGNIYASELLFASGVLPFKSCNKISDSEFQQIWINMKKILKSAIEKGGSTIDNYRNGYGQSGSFQKEFLVYGKEGFPCRNCNTLIMQKVLGGRSTFWCPRCQK